MHADLIIVLDDGEPVSIGKHEELLETCEIYREIYETQFSTGGDRK
jgi:ABC-type multidrug transport system fused ATPase/permease subunit